MSKDKKKDNSKDQRKRKNISSQEDIQLNPKKSKDRNNKEIIDIPAKSPNLGFFRRKNIENSREINFDD